MIWSPARLAILTFGMVALGALTWVALSRHPTTAEIEVCRSVLAKNMEASAAKWRARARGEDEPASESVSTADETAHACAPLYSVASCQNAWLHFREGDPASRARRLVEACRGAYCAKLSERKPALCNRDANSPTELSLMWRELDDAILSFELGARAEPIHAARRRGSSDIDSAMNAYFDAGSPSWRARSGDTDVRALPTQPEEKKREK